ncbi:hypothetical protein HGRIS_005904 [Hohenbuehelia grisea]|uniref:Epoxide hydrolase N-terminal domain-containing protein n=1 Tax=Hohenbuehelia grisea TaxID=104357 RepID=A0ABR3K0D7_9AGAR
MAETIFKLNVSDDQIANLRAKLELTTFPDELDNAGWQYGAPLADVRRLAERWKGGFDWRKHEAEINTELPQFTRDIEVDGFGALNIHYVHQKSLVRDAIPLLFVHGWPGSFLEARKIAPLLTASSPDQPSFHVVALSLPGYGFSEGPKKKGFRLAQYAEVGHKLMLSLGYNEYVSQGGDWGFYVTRKIAQVYGGKHCKAWHTNFPNASPPSLLRQPLNYISHLIKPYTSWEQAASERSVWFESQGRGYFAEQSTQPQTIGYSLTDSPVGLLAWIYEKLHNWTDAYPWEDDEVLEWVSIYWFSRAGPTASLRLYYEVTQSGDRSITNPPRIPLGTSHFPQELRWLPLSWIRSTTGNLVQYTHHAKGGHFAAHERPEDLVGDLQRMFGKKGAAFGVVSGKTGYA